jgi:hypothetical protein
MESEPVSRQASPLSTPALLSRLSFCIAWLFGLEAFLSEPSLSLTTARMRRADERGKTGRGCDLAQRTARGCPTR